MIQIPQPVRGNALLQYQGASSLGSMQWMVESLQAQVNKEHEDTAKSLAASQLTIDKVAALAQASSDQLKAQLAVSDRALALTREDLTDARKQLDEMRASNASAFQLLEEVKDRAEKAAAKEAESREQEKEQNAMAREALEDEVRRARAEGQAEVRSLRAEAAGALHRAHLEAEGAVAAAEQAARQQVAVAKEQAQAEVESSRASVQQAQRMMQSWAPAEGQQVKRSGAPATKTPAQR